MSAKVLQLVNSAFFGLARHVETVEQAVTLLGTEIIKSLVLSNAAFSQFLPRSKRFSPESLWRHSLLVGAIASAIAKAEGADRATVGEALQAGILHDIGQLILATYKAECYDEVLAAAAESNVPRYMAEADAFDATHAHIGAYLLGLWGLPDNTIEAVAFHHEPQSVAPAGFAPLVAVHVADALVHEALGEPTEGLLDEDVLEASGLEGRLPEWRAIAQTILNGTTS